MNREKEIKRRAFCTFIGAFIILAVINGTYNTFSVYVGDLCARLDASVAQVVLVFTVCSVSSMIINLLAAPLMKKVPMKILVLVGSIFFLAFFMLLRFATSLAMLYIGGALLGTSTVLCGLTTMQPLIGWWHAEGLGTKYGILSLSYALFGSLVSAIVPRLLLSAGFDMTTLVYGLVFSGIAIVSSVTLLSEKPEKYGLTPYGYSGEASAEGETEKTHELELRNIAKTSPFWLLLISPFLVTIALVGYTGNASTFYQSVGLSSTQAGIMISIYGITAMIFTMLFGILADRIGPRNACILYGVVSTATFAFGSVMTGQISCIIFSVLIGTINYTGLIVPTNAARIYGPSALSVIIPMAMISCCVGAMLGAPLAGLVYDSTGSYSSFMVCAAVLCLLAFLAVVKATTENTIRKVKFKLNIR